MSEENAVAVETVRARLQRWLADERIAAHLAHKVIRLDGEVVEDLDIGTAPSQRVVIAGL